MNQDQFVSLVQTILKAGGAALAAHGATIAQPATWQIVTGAVVTLAGWAWSHFVTHATPPTSTP